jgi:hypothetical protein
LEGFETGIEISVRLLLELGMNNKFIAYDDFVDAALNIASLLLSAYTLKPGRVWGRGTWLG